MLSHVSDFQRGPELKTCYKYQLKLKINYNVFKSDNDYDDYGDDDDGWWWMMIDDGWWLMMMDDDGWWWKRKKKK